MKSLATLLLVVGTALALVAAVDVKDAKAAAAPVAAAAAPPQAAPVAALAANATAPAGPITAQQAKRTLIVSGRGRYSLWVNMTEVTAAIAPIVTLEAAAAANQTATATATPMPDEHARSQAHAVYDKVMAVLGKYKALDISTPASFVSSPVFAPNSTAFKMLIAHQNKRFEAQRRIMAQRWGRSHLVMGQPMLGRAGEHQQIKPVTDKLEAETKEGEKKAETKKEEELPLPDPKTLVNFKGFRFYQPLRFVVPTAVIPELTQALRTVNTTIIGIKGFVPLNVLDDARNRATSEAVRHALVIADSALGAAGVKRSSIDNILVRTSPAPDFPLRMASAFIPPQHYVVHSNVVLSVSF